MQKKGMRYKRVQMKPVSSAKTDNVREIKKSVLPNSTFSLNVLSESGIIFVSINLFFKFKN